MPAMNLASRTRLNCRNQRPWERQPPMKSRVGMLRFVFKQHPVYALRSLSCDERSGQIELRGRVATFHLKQMAQEAIRAACSDVQIVNSVTVNEGDQ